jgi:hypothetical protein
MDIGLERLFIRIFGKLEQKVVQLSLLALKAELACAPQQLSVGRSRATAASHGRQPARGVHLPDSEVRSGQPGH